jgi:catechol 2,3-dioxygenase-like lactoylglutathione lyase family enzyme
MSLELDGLCTLLHVFDMRRSLEFYCGILGFERVQSAPPGPDCDWCWLKRGQAELMLNTRHERTNRPPHEEPSRIRAHGDTVLFLGCRDLDAAFAELRSRGLAVEPPVVRDYGMRQLSLRDPDGYAVCLQWKAK